MSQIIKPLTASGPIPPNIPTSFVTNSGTAIPAANILNVPGNNNANNGFATWTTGSGNTLTVNSHGPYKWIVHPTAGIGTHQTINAAILSSSPGDSIFITPGTYTENIVAPYSLNLIGPDVAEFDAGIPNVTIVGKISNATAGAWVSVVNMRLQTNGDYVLELSGAGASELYARNCYLQGANFSLTSSSNSSPSSNLILENCFGNLLTTGINVFNHSSSCILSIIDSVFFNGAVSTTPNTSSGTLTLDDVSFGSSLTPGIATTITSGNATITNSALQASGGPIILSGGATIIENCAVGTITMSNAATLTLSSSNTGAIALSNTSSATMYNSTIIASAGASGVTVNAGTSAIMVNSSINSVNTNAITGAGTISLSNISYGSSSLNNATTQTPLVSSNDAVKVKAPGAYPYTAVPQDAVIIVDSSSARTINLNASPVTGQMYRIKDNVGSAAANNITISPAAGNIDGAASYVINTNYASVDLVYSGAQWLVL